jgi:serine/threonine-protein kinase
MQFRSANRDVLAVSADGRRFAYNTNQGLYVRSMEELEGHLLPGTADALSGPFFSPDGQWIGYFQGGQLKRLALAGGAPVTIAAASNPYGATWADDGSIYFAQPDGIKRVPASGGTPELVVRGADGEVLDGPQLLPDGESLLFAALDGGRVTSPATSFRWDAAKVVVQSIRTGQRTVVIEGGSGARYVPSGHLVYAVGDGLFAVPFDVNTLTVRSGPVSVVQGILRGGIGVLGGGASGNYGVSDNGTLVYVVGSGVVASPVAWVDRDGRAEPIAAIPPDAFAMPRLSPDGARLLVHARGNLRIFDLPTGRESRVTTGGPVELNAEWSPDGRAVAYSSARAGQGKGVNVWMQPLDGSSSARPVTALEGMVHLDAWSPDGRTLAVHHHDPVGAVDEFMIAVAGDNGSKPQPFATEPAIEEAAVFSPDGRYVAYVSYDTGAPAVYVRPFPGPGPQTPVSSGAGIEPTWAANGELFYRRLEDYTMMAVVVATAPKLTVGPPMELFAGSGFPGGTARARYTVAADGKRFLMSTSLLASSDSARRSIRIVQHWVDELKRLAPPK